MNEEVDNRIWMVLREGQISRICINMVSVDLVMSLLVNSELQVCSGYTVRALQSELLALSRLQNRSS